MDATLIASLAALVGLALMVAGTLLATRWTAVVEARSRSARHPRPGRGTAHRQAHPHLRASLPRQHPAPGTELT